MDFVDDVRRELRRAGGEEASGSVACLEGLLEAQRSAGQPCSALSLCVLALQTLQSSNTSSSVVTSVLHCLSSLLSLLSAPQLSRLYSSAAPLLLRCSSSLRSAPAALLCLRPLALAVEPSHWRHADASALLLPLLPLACSSNTDARTLALSLLASLTAVPSPLQLRAAEWAGQRLTELLAYSERNNANPNTQAAKKKKKRAASSASSNAEPAVEASAAVGGDWDDERSALLLQFVETLGPFFPKSHVVRVSATLMQLLGVQRHALFVPCFRCLTALARADPVQHFFGGDYTTKLLQLLLQQRPGRADSAVVSQWAETVCALAEAAVASGRLDVAAPAAKAVMFHAFASSDLRVQVHASVALQKLFARAFQNGPLTADQAKPMLAVAEEGLAVTFRAAWEKGVFPLLSAVYIAVAKSCPPIALAGLTASLAALYENVSLEKAHPMVEPVLRSAVHCMGPEAFMRVVPLGMPGPRPRPWILPLMRDGGLHNTNLAFYGDFIMPLTKKLIASGSELSDEQQKDIQLVVGQLYGLFPALCVAPTDVAKAFPAIVGVLGASITKDPVLRPILCSGLANLIRSNQQIIDEDQKKNAVNAPAEAANVRRAVKKGGAAAADDDDDDDDDEHDRDERQVLSLATGVAPASASREWFNFSDYVRMPSVEEARANLDLIASRAEQLMPSLFNGYVNVEESNSSQRASVLTAIEALIAIAPPAVVNRFFRETVTMALQGEIALKQKQQEQLEQQQQEQQQQQKQKVLQGVVKMHNLSIAFIPKLEVQNAVAYYKALRAGLVRCDKVSCKGVAHLVRYGAANGFLASHAQDLAKALGESSLGLNNTNLTGSVRRFRVEIWKYLCLLDPDVQHMEATTLRECIMEVVLGTRESRKCRVEAMRFLKAICDHLHSADANNGVPSFVTRHLAAGLAVPDPTTMGAALVCISFVLRGWCKAVESIWNSLSQTCLKILCKTTSRELQLAVFRYFRAACKARQVGGIMNELLAVLFSRLPQQTRNHFRREIHVLTERMIRVLGADVVLDAMPTPEGRQVGLVLAKKLRKKARKRQKELNGGVAAADQDGKADAAAKGKKKDDKKKNKKKDAKSKGELAAEEEKLRTGELQGDMDDLLTVGSVARSAEGRRAALLAVIDDEEKNERGGGGKKDKKEDTPFRLDVETGLPIIADSDEEADRGGKRAKGVADEGDEDYVASEGGDDGSDDDEDEDAENEKMADAEDDAKKSARDQRRQRKPQKSAHSGDMYKAKKAGGDLQKGKFDPYAYVRLDPKNLNRRRAGHTADQFKDVLMRKKRSVQMSRKKPVGKKPGGRYYTK